MKIKPKEICDSRGEKCYSFIFVGFKVLFLKNLLWPKQMKEDDFLVNLDKNNALEAAIHFLKS